MASAIPHTIPDPALDLVLERVIDVPHELVWAAWTQPEQLKKWFTPKPWTTVDAEIDLRPGGIFRTVMQSPDGERHDNAGCILEVVPHERFAWTGALLPGFRPLSSDAGARFPFLFSAIIRLVPEGTGTKYTAVAIHADEQGLKAHAAMGFHRGWGAALDQLVGLARSGSITPAHVPARALDG